MLLLVVGHIGRGTGMRSRSHWLEGERRKEIRECVVERRGSIQRASLQPQLGDRDRDQSSPCGKKTFSADLQKSLRVQYVYSPSQPAIPRHETASLMAGHGTDECDLGQLEEDGSHKGKNSTCTVRHISRGWTAVVVTCPHMKTNSSWGTRVLSPAYVERLPCFLFGQFAGH